MPGEQPRRPGHREKIVQERRPGTTAGTSFRPPPVSNLSRTGRGKMTVQSPGLASMMLRAPTRTRISLRLSSAELSPKYAKLPCDGVALLSAESSARALGIHPRKLLANGGEEKYLDLFSRNIVRVARDFAPRPVVYRTLDMNLKECAALEGGAEYEE